MKKVAIAAGLLFACAGVFAAEVVESVVARVGDRVITRSQYSKRLHDGMAEIAATTPPEQVSARQEEFRKTLLEDMLNELLLKDRADRVNITVTQADVDGAVARLKKQFNIETDAQFADSLRKSGMTRADMETRLRDTLLTEKLFARELRSRQDLGDKELRERYEREKERYRLPERARVREIVVVIPEGSTPDAIASLKQRADEAVAKAKTEPDFTKVVTEYSDAPSKVSGGSLGDVGRGELLPELELAVFNTTAPAVVGPIRTKAGFHIFKVEERLPSEVPGFDTVKDRLRKDANEETFQRDLKAYLESLRKDAFVQINADQVPTS